MTTSVVIPTKNDMAHIDKCLSSLMPYYKAGYINEIVIVDGHSTDGTLDVIKKYPAKVTFEKVKGNVNYAFDQGWREAKGDIIILMNSDVYIGDAFFPKILDFLSDKKMGWISCHEKAVVSEGTSKSQAECWDLANTALSSRGLLSGLYRSMVWMGNKIPLRGGPCMVTRRQCLEEINGLVGLTAGTLEVCGDVCFSQRIGNKGWQTMWWTDAPVYHHPRTDLKGLNIQSYIYGKSIAYMQLEPEFKNNYPWQNKIIGIASRLGSPFVGIYLAVRYRNPFQLIVYPVPRFYWMRGYIIGWVEAKKPNQPIYSQPDISKLTIKL